MKTPRFLLILLLLFFVSVANAQYKLSDNNSKVQFTVINHLVFKTTVNGYFKDLKGTVNFSTDHLSEASIVATVNVNTISTGISKRDKDLQGEDYFNAAKFPTMQLKSVSITSAGKPNTYQLTAALTIKGITKNVTFPFTAIIANVGCQLNATFTINRKDFNVGPDNPIDDKITGYIERIGDEMMRG